MLTALASKVYRVWYGMFMLQKWTIGLSTPPIHTNTNWLNHGRLIPPLKGADFLADPFVVPGTGGKAILCEWMRSDLGRGVIARVTLDSLSGLSDVSVVIDRNPYHLSYPHVFLFDGELYCCPESCHSRSVRLYRLDPTASRVLEERDIITNVAAVDPTIFRHENRWWLLCTNARGGLSNSELHAFYADHLYGPWTPHSGNPVVRDVGSARPAGRVFVADGHLYRPSQDCRVRYGGGLNLSRIDVLNSTQYEETRIWSVHSPVAKQGMHGIHTVNAVDDTVVYDVYSETFNPLAWWYRLKEIRLQRRVPQET